MITQQQAILSAQMAVKCQNFIDPINGVTARFSSRTEALKAGVKNDPSIRDKWVIDFNRVPTGSPLDGLHDHLSVWVDAETGQTQIIDSF